MLYSGGWTIVNPNTTNSYYSFQSNEVIQYLISNTTGNQYYQKIKQGIHYASMGSFTIGNYINAIDFIPISQNIKNAPLEVTLNNNYIYLIPNCDGNSNAYIKTSSTYNSSTNNGSIYYSTMHQNWTKFLILLSNRNKIPSSYTSVVEFGLGGCGYSGASTYLNMPDGTIGAKGTLGYR